MAPLRIRSSARRSSIDDVLVVGAGPAGSMAAAALARAGLRVRLIDRARFPRPKLCGDTLNPGALSLLPPALRAQVEQRGLPITGMTVTGPGGTRVTAEYPHGCRGIALRREDLDTILLQSAIDAGAAFEPEVSATGPVIAPDGVRVSGVRVGAFELRARIVIAAEGRQARLAAARGLSRFAASPKRWACGAYFTGADGLTSRGEMHIRPDGYIGVAPLPGGLVNVCVVREWQAFRPKADAARTWMASDVIAGAIASDPALRDRFARARQVTPPVTLGPLAIESVAAGCPGLLLAGDAAGFVDPMTGDGLRFALAGGMLAARAAIGELETGVPAFGRLGAMRAGEFAAKWRLNRGLRALVGSPRAVRAAARLTRYWPAPVRHLVALAGDVPLALRTCRPSLP